MIKKNLIAPVEEPKSDPFNGLTVSNSAVEKQNKGEENVVRPPEGAAPVEPNMPSENVEMTNVN